MFPNRRNVQPPFEAMRGTAAPGPPQVLSKSPPPARTADPSQAGDAAGAGRWVRSRQPITLRIPPGYAIIIALGMLAVLLAASRRGLVPGSSLLRTGLGPPGQAERDIGSRVIPPTQSPPTRGDVGNRPAELSRGHTERGSSPDASFRAWDKTQEARLQLFHPQRHPQGRRRPARRVPPRQRG